MFFISVTMESVWLCYAWEGLLYLVQWQCHQSLCQVLYDHQPGEPVPIPPCPEDTHPLHAFEETHVDATCTNGWCLSYG